jgi:hypothetical protein
MATDNNRGYSDALGGYGVPAQVQASAPYNIKSTAAAGSRRSGGVVFRPKPKNILFLAVIAAAIVIVILLATGVIGGGLFASKYAEDIQTIEKQQQITNGAEATNYMVILADTADWSNISDAERKGIAKYAAEQALEQARTDQAGIFNIIGLTTDRKPVFMYSSDGRVQIMADGSVRGEVSVDPKYLE